MEPNVIFIELEKPTLFMVAKDSTGGEKVIIRLRIHDNLLVRLTYYVIFKDYSTGYIVDTVQVEEKTLDITVISIDPVKPLPSILEEEHLLVIPFGYPPVMTQRKDL